MLHCVPERLVRPILPLILLEQQAPLHAPLHANYITSCRLVPQLSIGTAVLCALPLSSIGIDKHMQMHMVSTRGVRRHCSAIVLPRHCIGRHRQLYTVCTRDSCKLHLAQSDQDQQHVLHCVPERLVRPTLPPILL